MEILYTEFDRKTCYFRPSQLPSIEEAFSLPIPAELTSRQGNPQQVR